MDFSFTAEQESFREEVRDFLTHGVTPSLVRERLGIGDFSGDSGPETQAFLRKLGAKGWIALTWPREHGGQTLPTAYKLILADECAYHFLPVGSTASAVAPTIMLFGTEDQKRLFLPPIARGEVDFALGYTEPEAGSDLGSLRMRAVVDGDEFVVSGQKLFSSACHHARYHWLAVRTDVTAPKHKGISLLIVDMNASGITVHPIGTMSGTLTNAVFYQDVRVPRDRLVGGLNQGWHCIMTALNLERIFATGSLQRVLDDLTQVFAHSPQNDTARRISRHRLAEMAVEIEVCRALSYRLTWLQDKGRVPDYEASELKVFLSELRQRLANVGMTVLGLHGQLETADSLAPLRGIMSFLYKDAVLLSISSGANEIQRNLIAARGLGLPS